MYAKFETTCHVCRGRIRKGELLGRADGKWAHRNCAQHQERSKALKHRLVR